LAQANLYRNTDRVEEAKQPLLTALEIAPDNPGLYMNLAWLAHSQEDFGESLDWFRKGLSVDPEDAQFAANIARIFYEFGLLQKGDVWSGRVRTISPERTDLIMGLEIEAAAAAKDQSRLLEVVERALPLVLTAEVDYFLPTIYYPSIMSEQGRSQEGLDYLAEVIPGVLDYTRLIDDNRFAQYLQLVSFNLEQDLMDRESFQELAELVVNNIEARYPDIYDSPASVNTINKAMISHWLGDSNRALEFLLEGHADWPMFNGQWLQLQIYPWFEYLRENSEMMAAIDQYEQKKRRMAAELREMVKQPEWQH